MKKNHSTPKWLHSWNIEVFDDLQHDTRFFSIIMRGLLAWLDSNIKMYNKGIRHFILNTGKEYLYQESNGYNFSWKETTGEDYIYMTKPRCVVTWEEIEIDPSEMSSPYTRGTYERLAEVEDDVLGKHVEVRQFSSEIKILPVKMPISLKYVLSNFNEALILTEELLSILTFTRYFSVSYLGQKIECSIEFPNSITPAKQIKVDYNAENKSREVDIKLDLKTYFPVMLQQSEVDASRVIESYSADIYTEMPEETDTVTQDNHLINIQRDIAPEEKQYKDIETETVTEELWKHKDLPKYNMKLN